MILIAAIAFLAMGLLALIAPQRITRMVGLSTLPMAARNEVRAVYGGLGALLLLSGRCSHWQPGVVLTVAMALLGMALGRLVAWGVDGRLERFPALFLVGEAALGIGLLLTL
jgi:hypothetical protein